MNGIIIKGIGGFYYVKTEDDIFECTGRGIFKKKGIKLQVGDRVVISEKELSKEARERGISHEGVIEEVLDRKNSFIRPPIVNVDTFAVTFAVKDPDPDFSLIDKFLVMAEMNHVDALIVMNKCDLADEETLEAYEEIYRDIYPVIRVSGKGGEGIEKLEELILGRTVAFAGPSGVGKSTLINLLIPEAEMATGEISKKTSRGRHTTRHVEIFESKGGGLVYDTPGFTSFDILEAETDELQDYYPDIAQYKGKCYYDNCRHLKEPDCAVKQAVREGKISKVRYLSYKKNIEEIKEKRKY
ncbi:MAG: ribosome small subunit-dependent GTPase A [Firmicutes bacterium]|nr:ribosome small subunit-dependent GTPase A [Bacillota bacterium]